MKCHETFQDCILLSFTSLNTKIILLHYLNLLTSSVYDVKIIKEKNIFEVRYISFNPVNKVRTDKIATVFFCISPSCHVIGCQP